MDKPAWLEGREQEAWRGFLTMHAQLSGHLRRSLQQRSGLSDADYQVLVALSEAPQGRLRGFQLGRALQWEKSRLSHHLRRMADRGLVEKADCETDGRGAYVVITQAGRCAIEAAAPGHVDDVRRVFFDALTPAQVEALAQISGAVLTRLADVSDQQEGC